MSMSSGVVLALATESLRGIHLMQTYDAAMSNAC